MKKPGGSELRYDVFLIQDIAEIHSRVIHRDALRTGGYVEPGSLNVGVIGGHMTARS